MSARRGPRPAGGAARRPTAAPNLLPAGWREFFFAPESVAPLVLVRVGYGVLVTAWAVSLLPDVRAFFTPAGIQPAMSVGGLNWSVFAISDSPAVVTGAAVVLVLAGLALIAGLATRVAAALAFVLITSFERRTLGIFNAGDTLLRLLGLYLALTPAGAAVSLDSLRSPGGPWRFPLRAPWGLRLMQLQLSAVYLGSVLEKLRGQTWRDGTALGYALQLHDVERFGLFHWIASVPALVSIGTYGTLVVELAVGVCVWLPRFRLPAMLAGVALHVGIGLAMRVGFFSAAMLVLYLAFVPPEAAQRLLMAMHRRLVRRKSPAVAQS
jgi:hypothetical protein